MFPSYTDVPLVFRHKDNEWLKCANHIIDTGQSVDVRLVPRPGTNADLAWQRFHVIASNEEITDWHKKALCAWVLYSGFERCFYEYD